MQDDSRPAVASSPLHRPFLIYGATGYTGNLIAREAARRGLRPILAGRSSDRLEPLARELGLAWRAFPLDRPDLSGCALVLHCAGPFIETSRPMVDACLEASIHYLDITGEIPVFEAVYARDAEAKAHAIALIPGVGFDVVPTDAIAAMLSRRLPDATELQLAFSTSRGSAISPGTLQTMIESIGEGGAIRREGKIVRVPHAYDVREIPFPSRSRFAVTIPWGDVASAYRTTRIPDIRVYNGTSKKGVQRLRRMARFAPVAAFWPIRKTLRWMASRVKGPTEEQQRTGRVELWGRVANGKGEETTMTMTTPEGYTFTVLAALSAVERVLADPPPPGAHTPSTAFGPELALGIEGVEVQSF